MGHDNPNETQTILALTYPHESTHPSLNKFLYTITMRFSHSSNVSNATQAQQSTVAQSIRRLTTPRLLILLGMVLSCFILLNLSTDVTPTGPPGPHRRLSKFECPKCDGSGKVPGRLWGKNKCPQCNGQKLVTKLEVRTANKNVNGFYFETHKRKNIEYTLTRDRKTKNIPMAATIWYNNSKSGWSLITYETTYSSMTGSDEPDDLTIAERYFNRSSDPIPPASGWELGDYYRKTDSRDIVADSLRVHRCE